jgi:fructosamine-3-kinase
VSASELAGKVEKLTGSRPVALRPLSGGCVSKVYEARFDDGTVRVIKSTGGGAAEIEAWMLDYLQRRSRLPVPRVLSFSSELLVLERVADDGTLAVAEVESQAADLLADLHDVEQARFGLERDTLIGGLPQPNTETSSWIDFFRDHRLLFMGRMALDAGAIDARVLADVERLCGRIESWVDPPPRPSLLHGDVWSGNVLAHGGRVTAFVDPAIYYGDSEVELAFVSLFSTFGSRFFDRYRERRPIAPGFLAVRKDLYNLYPLLVHAALFGGQYAGPIRGTLKRLLG